MKINQIQISNTTNKFYPLKKQICNTPTNTNLENNIKVSCYNINFGNLNSHKRSIRDIEYDEYIDMKEPTKKRLRKLYYSFDKLANKKELVDLNFLKLPLQSEHSMDEFIKTAQIYSKYKDKRIICLGRSPKWFLNANLWMKDGIDKYIFTAFSGYWYRPDNIEGMKRNNFMAPSKEEELAYRRYLTRIEADPIKIIKNYMEGKKTVITDYIFSGKGVCSFLDVLSHFAEDLGVLEPLSKAIEIVGIGSLDYMEEMNPYAEAYEIALRKYPLLGKIDSVSALSVHSHE